MRLFNKIIYIYMFLCCTTLYLIFSTFISKQLNVLFIEIENLENIFVAIRRASGND